VSPGTRKKMNFAMRPTEGFGLKSGIPERHEEEGREGFMRGRGADQDPTVFRREKSLTHCHIPSGEKKVNMKGEVAGRQRLERAALGDL